MNGELNRTTKDWHPECVTLSETKGLSERFLATLSNDTSKGPERKVYEYPVV